MLATIAERIKEGLSIRGMKQADLVDRTGIGKSSISTYLTGEYEPKQRNLYKIAFAMGVSPAWLMGLDVPMDHEEVDVEVPDVPHSAVWSTPLVEAYIESPVLTQQNVCKLLEIPHVRPTETSSRSAMRRGHHRRRVEIVVYGDPSYAGSPFEAGSDFERLSFDESEIPAGADFGVRISGESMAPTIANGSIVWVRMQPYVSDGEIGIFTLVDGSVCKRAHISASGRLIRLESDNPAYPPITGEDLRDARCVGKVLF